MPIVNLTLFPLFQNTIQTIGEVYPELKLKFFSPTDTLNKFQTTKLSFALNFIVIISDKRNIRRNIKFLLETYIIVSGVKQNCVLDFRYFRAAR